MSERPNVIMLMTDELRGDCLGIMGHPDVKTTWLDSLAAGGILYDHAYSACPTCIPARAGLYTGMSQERHGRVGYQDGIAWNYPHTIASEFAAAGYYTKCVGKMHVHPLRNLMGFHDIELHDGYLHYYRRPETPGYEDQRRADDYFHYLKNVKGIDADVTDTGLDCNSWMTRPWHLEESLHPTRWVTDHTLDWLRRRDHSKPFFLQVSYLRPHAPYDAPQTFFDMYADKELRPAALGDWEDNNSYKTEGRIFNASTSPADPELDRRAQMGYYACISQLDYEIGRLMMVLIEERLLDNTIILFTSDHGEMLGDHRFSRKSLPYEGSAHVPMILSGPAKYMQGREGTVDSRVVELRDVMPTLLEMAGVPVPDTVDGLNMLEGAPREFLHGEHGDMSQHSKRSMHYIVTEKDKYIWFAETGREQYFDLVKDPRELHDAIRDPEYQERIAVLRQDLIEALKGREEGFTDGSSLIPGRPYGTVLHSVLG